MRLFPSLVAAVLLGAACPAAVAGHLAVTEPRTYDLGIKSTFTSGSAPFSLDEVTLALGRPPNTVFQHLVSQRAFVGNQEVPISVRADPSGHLFSWVDLKSAGGIAGPFSITVWNRIEVRGVRFLPGPLPAGYTAPTLSDQERRASITSTGIYDYDSPIFRQFLAARPDALRKPQESLEEYARRAAQGVMELVSYSSAPVTTFKASHTLGEGRLVGDCGCRAALYCALLRCQGIPARVLPGCHTRTAARADFFHVDAEVFIDGIGWVPVDVGNGKDGVGRLDDFIILQQDANCLLPDGTQTEFLQTGSWRGMGRAASSLTFSTDWAVQPVLAQPVRTGG